MSSRAVAPRLTVALATFAALLCSATPVAAQSESAFVGWIGLTRTPVAALAPVPISLPGVPRGKLTYRARTAFWSFGPGDDETTNIGIGIGYRVGASELRLDLARSTNAQCAACTATLAGMDLVRPIKVIPFEGAGQSSLTVALNPAVGYASDDDVQSLTLAMSLPIEVRLPISARWHVTPFVSPGFGLARISSAFDASTGHRAFVGAGAAAGTSSGAVEVSVGFRRVLLEGAPETVGVNLALRPR